MHLVMDELFSLFESMPLSAMFSMAVSSALFMLMLAVSSALFMLMLAVSSALTMWLSLQRCLCCLFGGQCAVSSALMMVDVLSLRR